MYRTVTRHCRAQTFKLPGPDYFTSFSQNWFNVLHIIFLNFIKELKNAFLSFASIQVLIVLSNFNDFAFVCTVSRAHPSWPEGCYHTGRIFSNDFLILCIISDVTKKYSSGTVWKRKYPQYLDRHEHRDHLLCQHLMSIFHRLLDSSICAVRASAESNSLDKLWPRD